MYEEKLGSFLVGENTHKQNPQKVPGQCRVTLPTGLLEMAGGIGNSQARLEKVNQVSFWQKTR